MNAEPFIMDVVSSLAKVHLQAVLIGNAAAALHGAPVTTDDLDFMFRATPQNKVKLMEFARLMNGRLEQPQYPVSKFYRVIDSQGRQVDLMGVVHGVRSFESLRSRAKAFKVGAGKLLVADMGDIIKSKREAGRKKDLAVLPLLEVTHAESKKKTK